MKYYATLFVFFLVSISSFAANHYWIGSSGNWNDANNWSLTSGGAAGITIPGIGDNAIFDDNSGLISPLDIVTLDVNLSVDTFDFSGVSNVFTFDSPAAITFEVQASLYGNISGVNFTGTWGEITMNAINPGEIISSQGTIWTQVFRINGDLITLADDFINNNSIWVDFGGIDLNSNSVICSDFNSNTINTRTITITNGNIAVTNGYWEIDATNLTWSAGSSAIALGDNTGISDFYGGGLAYDTVRSVSATQFKHYNNNQFALLEVVQSSQLEIENGMTLQTDSLIAVGSCLTPLIITTTAVGANAMFEKTGYQSIDLASVDITDVDAIGTATHNVINSTTTNAANWNPIASGDLYWIGNTGNWNDGLNWSFTSGGVPSGCIPDATTPVYFDVNSFTLAGQTVTVDSVSYFLTMDWTGITANQSLRLDTNVFAYGDITLDSNLLFARNQDTAALIIKAPAQFLQDTAQVDAIILVAMDNNADIFQIADNLIMSDSSVISMARGQFDSQNFDIQTGTIYSEDTITGGGDSRQLDLGSSFVEIYREFNSINDNDLTVNAGTSHIYIGDTVQYTPSRKFLNGLKSSGHTFYDVTLNFQEYPNSTLQTVNGDNSFNKLRILPGSEVYLEESTTQTVNDSLIMTARCNNSIYLGTSDTTATNNTAFLNLVNNIFDVEAVTLELIDATAGVPITAYHSEDSVSNPGWVFDLTPATTANFTADGPFCLGDTTQFTNLSTVQTGDLNDMESHWYYSDGTSAYWQPVPPPEDSIFVTYEVDTNQHVFAYGGLFNVKLVTTNKLNGCTDEFVSQVAIYDPSIILLTSEPDFSICNGEEVIFEAFSSSDTARFEFFLNGVSLNTPSMNDSTYTTSSLVHEDTISVLAHEEFCVSDTMPALVYTVYDLPTFDFTSSDANNTICETDSVYFTATNLLEPTHDYQFLINGTSVTGYIDSLNYYGLDTLANNDVIYAVARDTLGCRDTLTITFTVDPLPTTSLAESSGGSSICLGDLITFTGTGADQYEFFINGISVQGPSALDTYSTSTLTANDTVTVNGINATGCEQLAPESYNYIVNPIPTTTMSSSDLDNIICSGEEVVFTGSGAPMYEFFINGSSVQTGPSNTHTTSTLNDGDVILVEGLLGACSSPATAINMTVFTSPTTAMVNDDNGDNTICYGTPVTFTASGATNYEFFVDGISVQGPSTTSTYSTSALLNGQVLTVEGESNTCIISQSHNFTVLNNPVVNLFSDDADNTICDGDPIEFTGVNAGSYEFFVNGSSVQGPSVLTTLSSPALNIGANQVQMVGIAGNGCTDTSALMNITVNPIPVITMTSSDLDNTICANEQVTFTGTGADMYQFYIGATPQGAMSPTNTFSTSNLLDGQTVSISGSLLGCPSTSNGISTTVNPIPSTSLVSTDINNVYCETDLVDYTAGGATNYEFFVDGTSQGPSSPLNTISSTGFPSGSFPVTVVGEANNCYDTTTVSVLINSSPTASISSSDPNNIICEGEAVIYTGTGGNVYEFFVNGNTQGSPSIDNTILLNSLIDGDEVSVTVATAQGCEDSDTMALITVNPTPIVGLLSSDPNFEICIGDNVDFTASGATEYEFFINGVSQGPPSTNTIFSTAGLTNGDNISVEGSSLGCYATSNNISFTVYGYPVVSLVNNGDNTICVGENTDLTAGGAMNYQFHINGSPVGPFTPVNTFTNSLNNGDVVTVLGETNGCASSATNNVSYTVYSYPSITSLVNPGTTICLNDLVSVSSSGAMTYDFDVNGSTVQSGASTSFDTDLFEDGDVITVTGFNGDCPSTPDVFNFTVNTMVLDMTVTPSSMICDGTPVTFTASGADEYEFFLNGISVGPLSATNTFNSSTLNDTDEITFTGVNTTTMCTQPYEDYILMNVLDEPVVSPQSSTSFCEGDSVILVSNSAYGNQWLVDGIPIVGATDTNYVAYSSGQYTLDITSGGNGTVWSFGQNASGMFGNGTNFNNADPTIGSTSEFFDELSSGYSFIMGITTTGDLYAWGDNSSGQLGDGTYTATNIPQAVPTMTNLKTVATSENSTMAVSNTGDVYVWGNNTQGQLGTGNTSVITFPFQNTALNNTDTIAGGKEHFVILKNDGTVWTVGNNDHGQLGQGNLLSSMNPIQVSGLSNIVSIGSAEYSSFAIDVSGDLYVWGNNGSGQLGLGDLNNRLDPTLSPLKDVSNVQGGAAHTAFLTSDNEVYTSGNNTFGQLGTGDFADTTLPVQVAISGVDLISTGQYTTLAKRSDMSVFGFGNNVEEQLSSTNGTAINLPEHISDLDGAVFIEAGRYSSHVIYGEDQMCSSQIVDVTMLTVPVVTITSNVDTLSTIAGDSYQWYFEGNPIPGATSQTYIANESGNYFVEVTIANGCMATSDNYYHSMSSIYEHSIANVNVYPNPSSGIFTISAEGIEMELKVLDVSGKVLLEQRNIVGETSIDLTGYAKSMYFLQISTSDGMISKKLMLK